MSVAAAPVKPCWVLMHHMCVLLKLVAMLWEKV
jgi:hypothetical protein